MLNHQGTAGLDKCGSVVQLPDKQGEAVAAYVVSAVAQGLPLLLTYTQTEGREVTGIAPATMAFNVRVGVALEAIAAGKIGLVQISGLAECLCDETGALSAGRCMRVIDAATYLTDDGGTSRTASTLGFLVDAITADENSGTEVLKTVMMIGEQAIIDAS